MSAMRWSCRSIRRALKPARVLVHDNKVPRDEALLLDLEQPDMGIRRSVQPAKLPPAAAVYLAPRPRVTYYFDTVAAASWSAPAELAEAG